MFGPGYLVIGDAYAFIDPVFSSGVYLAMSSAASGIDVADAWLRGVPLAACAEVEEGTEEGRGVTVVADIAANEGPVTVLVNNAGITRDNLLLRMKPDEWDAILNTNLSSVYRTSRACLRGMMKARRGRIINIGSVVGLMGNPGQANYCAAKAGIVGFTRALAREVGSRGITVNTVAPGFIETDMTRALDEGQRDAMASQIPLGRLGAPEDIAAAVLYLASAAGGYVTGETLNVNGGLYMAS
jgi:3-oxoacyl-[acyl-carrier protein] reductase